MRQAVGNRGVGFIEQREQNGTGHALMVGREALASMNGRLMVLYGDGPLISAGTLERLASEQKESGAAATLITTMLDDPHGYGRVLRDEDGAVAAIVEQKAATPGQLLVKEINSGIYCFRAADFWEHLDRIRPDNPAREYYLTDIVRDSEDRAGRQRVRCAMRVENPAEVLGINNRIELAQVDAIFRTRKVEELMLSGVTIEKPETVSIDMRTSALEWIP